MLKSGLIDDLEYTQIHVKQASTPGRSARSPKEQNIES